MGNNDNIPIFGAPDQQSDIPTFRIPNQQSNIPTFRAPEQHGDERSRPNYRHYHSNVERCSYHPNNISVMRCDTCGRPICSSCRDVGELSDGHHVCFDCASSIVETDISIAKEKRSAIVKKIILGVLGAIVFGIISTTTGFKIFWNPGGTTTAFDTGEIFKYQVLFTLFGASLSLYLPVLKGILKWIWKLIRWKPGIKPNIVIEIIVTAIKFFGFAVILFLFITVFSTFLYFSPLIALIIAIVDSIRYKKASDLVKRNQEILQHLSDRMEYIRIQSEENIDVETLANDVRMENNQFAQAVRRNGYVSASRSFSGEAQEMAENDRKIKAFINDSGEIVRTA